MDKAFGKKAQEIVINIKANMQTIRKMAMEFLHGQVAMYTKAIMRQT